MISALSILLLALAAPAAPAAPAEPPRAAALAEAPLFPRCRDGALDVDALIADRPALQAAASVPLGELPDYLACRGLAAARPSCPELEGLGGGLSDAAASCRDLEWEAKFVQAIVRGGDAAGLCRGRFSGRGATPGAEIAACSSIIEAGRSGRPDSICAAYVTAGLGTEKDSESCRKKMSYWTGRAESCGGLGDPVQRGRCRQLAALVAGLRGAKACAASPLCSVFEKGDPEACAPFKNALSRRVCVQADRHKAQAEQEERRQAQAKKKEAMTRANRKPQFQKGQAMKTSDTVVDVMKKLANGEKAEAPKSKGESAESGDSDEKQTRH